MEEVGDGQGARVNEAIDEHGDENARINEPRIENIDDQANQDDGLIFELQPVAGRPDENSWSLPTGLATHHNTNTRVFVRNRQLREQITEHYPAPSNIDGCPELDEYMRQLIRGANNNTVISRDDELRTLHQFAHQITGPLGDAWAQLKIHRRDPDNPDTALDLEGMAERFQFSVALLAQLMYRISYSRRVNALSGVPGYTQRRTAEEHVRRVFWKPIFRDGYSANNSLIR